MVAIRHKIRYLGFVVDVGLPGIDQVTHAMVNLEENPELWYIIELSSSRYQHTLQDSVGRYFRTIFSLSVDIWSAYKLTGRLDRDQPIPGADTLRLREYAEYLREVDRADKLKAAAPEFPRIRRAIHGSLFCPVGTKQNDTLHLEWKGAATPTQIFFWTKCEFEASSLKGATGLPFGTIMTAEAESPTTRLLPEQFEGMAVSFGLMQPPCSWQDLYLSALIKGSEIQDFIDIGMATMGNRDAAPSVRGNKKASGYRASQLLDAMTQGATIGVVAPSGCGKSTVLRWIAGAAAKRKAANTSKWPFPMVLRLKHFGEGGSIDVKDALQKSIVESLCVLSTNELSVWEGIARVRPRKDDEYGSKRQILAEISSQVRDWLEKDNSLSHVALCVDGLGDVQSVHEYALRAGIADTLQRCYAAIVSGKREIERVGEVVFSLCLRLEPVTGAQMLWYLRRTFPKQAGRVVSMLEQKHPRVFDLVSRPFALNVLRRVLDPEDLDSLPSAQAGLIRSFIDSAVDRRLKSNEARWEGISPARFNYDLSILAERILSQSIAGEEPCIRYPSGLAAIGYESGHLDKVLELAESVGVLHSSGLHYDGGSDQNRIEFEHDLFRDYFAAVWLMNVGFADKRVDRLGTLMGNKMWDSPIKMYLELADQSSSRLDHVIRQVAEYDPYFAAECIEIREDWSEETIAAVFSTLKRWEFDLPGMGETYLSREGIMAARVLMGKLSSNTLISMFQRGMVFSLELLAGPTALMCRPDIDRWAVFEMMRECYSDDHVEYLLDGLALWDDAHAFELLVCTLDRALTLRQENLWSEAVTRHMQIVFPAAFRPDKVQADRLCCKLSTPWVRELVYFVSHCSEAELEELREHLGPVVGAVAAFKLSADQRDDFRGFHRHISTVDPVSAMDPLLYFMIATSVSTSPSDGEHVLRHWLDSAMEAGYPPAILSNILGLLASCQTQGACEAIVDTLLDGDPSLVEDVLQGDPAGMRNGPCLPRLIAEVKSRDAVSGHSRTVFVRFALGDRLSEHELCELDRLLGESYEQALAGSSAMCTEFHLRLMCALSRPAQHFEQVGRMDRLRLAEIVPEALVLIRGQEGYEVLEELMSYDVDEYYEHALEMAMSDALPFEGMSIDGRFAVLYRICQKGSRLNRLMQVLWERVRSCLAKNDFLLARKLIYLAMRFESKTGRRWVGLRVLPQMRIDIPGLGISE